MEKKEEKVEVKKQICLRWFEATDSRVRVRVFQYVPVANGTWKWHIELANYGDDFKLSSVSIECRDQQMELLEEKSLP